MDSSVVTYSASGYGVYGDTGSGSAGYFHGRVVITSLGTGGAGSPLCRNGNHEIADCSSSLRYKTDVRSFTRGLDIVTRLRPITFTWKDGGLHDIGRVAEEVEQVAPLLTFRNDKGEIEGVRYSQLSAVFVNAFVERQTQIQRQQEEIRQQRERVTAQQHELAALKTLVCRSQPEADVCR